MTGYHVAKELLRKNIQVIPLNDYKKPTVSFADVIIDNDFIEYHEYKYQNTNVLGVLTRGVWCIDIDVDHAEDKNGFESLEHIPFYDEVVTNAKNTMVQTTPSGGRHIIFKKRDGINYGQKIDYLPSVDIKVHSNNYFVLAGSRTAKGVYTHNGVRVTEYDGEFEQRIFEKRGNYTQQTLEPHSVKNVLPDYNFDHLGNGSGGLGKQAYQRIINGESSERNSDLYLAASYAKQCNIDIEPLKVLVGDVRNGDEFKHSEWEGTVRSAGY